MLCDYGCGKESSFQLKNGKSCCSKRPAGCDVLKKVNSIGVQRSHKTVRQPQKQIYQNLPQSTKDRMMWSKGKQLVPNDEVFVENSSFSTEAVKFRIIDQELIAYECQQCGISDWHGEHLVLELDHKNGRNNDHRLENLRFLCPNCHSLTPTFRGRNKNSGQVKVSDNDLLTAYRNCSNIRQALILVGLAPKGGNYARVNKLIKNNASVVKLVDARDL